MEDVLMDELAAEEMVHGGLIMEGHAVEVIDSCVKNGQTVEVEAYMASNKNTAEIREYAWDIVPKVCSYLTEENLTNKPDVITACEIALKYMCESANQKELLLSLLEQADALNDNVKFQILLPPLQKCLQKLPSKQGHSLAIALETLMGHIEGLPLPDDQQLEGEEKMLMDNDARVSTITDALTSMTNFLEPFVDEVSLASMPGELSKDQLKQRTEIIKFCLRLLGLPLVFLDLSISRTTVKKKPENQAPIENGTDQSTPNAKEMIAKSASRYCAEKLVTMISKLHGNPISLLDSITLDNARIEQDRKRLKSKVKVENGEGDIPDDDGIQLEEAIPVEALATFAYLVFSENLGQKLLPAVYTSRFIFEHCFPYSVRLLKETHSLVAYKGVKLLLAVASGLQACSLSVDLLESEATQDLLVSLIAIMTRAHMKELRQTAAQVVPHLLKAFNTKGRYLFLNFMMRKSASNWGVRGLTISLLKDEIDRNLKLPTPNTFFTGTHLERLLITVFSLPKGAETDLLDSSDQVMSALNLLRYLVLRDNPTKNVTGIWNYLPRIKENYLEILRTAINMSRAHYELEKKHIKESKGESSSVDASIQLGGQPMPKLSMQQQMQAMQMALSTFDMMESIVVRVSELLDQQKNVPVNSGMPLN